MRVRILLGVLFRKEFGSGGLFIERAHMGKLYRDKKSSGCALCKPHKHGWAPKFKDKELEKRARQEKEMRDKKKLSA